MIDNIFKVFDIFYLIFVQVLLSFVVFFGQLLRTMTTIVSFFLYINIKGTVSVSSSDRLCKNGNVRFTTVLLKPLFNQHGGEFRFSRFKIVQF